jgi:hypothetical protein
MRGGATLISLAVTVVLAGCSRRSLTPYDFQFVTTNTTFADLSSRVGRHHRMYQVITNDNVVPFFEWDLTSADPAGRYVMLLSFEGPHPDNWAVAPSNTVRSIKLVRRPAFINFSTNGGNHDGDHRP